VNAHHIKRTFTFPDFVSALAFVNKVGDVAEKEGHHPDIFLT
jgi:4a-hydroxytetrahydrobiopterin dehydratase